MSAARMTVSYAELARLGVHALRGLGYSFSVAERSAHVLAATEAVTGQGLGYLSRQERRIADSSRSTADLTVVEGGVTRLDGRQKSLLELSPFIVDLVAADVRRRRTSVLAVDHCHGAPFIADLALRARNANLALLMLYQDDDVDQSGKVLVDGRGIEGSAIRDGEAAAALVDGWLTRAAASPVGGRPNLLCLAGNGDGRDRLDLSGLYREIGGEIAGAAWQGAAAWAGKFGAAIQGHIMADPAEFGFFTRCVARIWAPTSERSRGQQG
jgi:hypothetical protein